MSFSVTINGFGKSKTGKPYRISRVYGDSVLDQTFINKLLNVTKFIKFEQSGNLRIQCPECDYPDGKPNLSINLKTGVCRCFTCSEYNGSVLNQTLINKLLGEFNSKEHVDYDKLSTQLKKNKKFGRLQHNIQPLKLKVKLPKITPDIPAYEFKVSYLKRRLPNVDIMKIPGLVLDVYKFYQQHNKAIDFREVDHVKKARIGFCCRHGVKVITRFLDRKYYDNVLLSENGRKFGLLDYYCCLPKVDLPYLRNVVVLAEGVFDILTEYYFNFLDFKDRIRAWVATGSASNYPGIIQSIVYDELWPTKFTFIILCDSDIKNEALTNMLRWKVKNFIQKVIVYRNKFGKDWNDLLKLDHSKIKSAIQREELEL